MIDSVVVTMGIIDDKVYQQTTGTMILLVYVGSI